MNTLLNRLHVLQNIIDRLDAVDTCIDAITTGHELAIATKEFIEAARPYLREVAATLCDARDVIDRAEELFRNQLARDMLAHVAEQSAFHAAIVGR